MNNKSDEINEMDDWEIYKNSKEWKDYKNSQHYKDSMIILERLVNTVVVDFLEYCPEYKEFIQKEELDSPGFYTKSSYLFFGMLRRYMIIEYKKGNIELVKKIFLFLDKMDRSEDQNIQDLLYSGCLENFDQHKDILSELIKLMPDTLRNNFTNTFPEYLDPSKQKRLNMETGLLEYIYPQVKTE